MPYIEHGANMSQWEGMPARKKSRSRMESRDRIKKRLQKVKIFLDRMNQTGLNLYLTD